MKTRIHHNGEHGLRNGSYTAEKKGKCEVSTVPKHQTLCCDAVTAKCCSFVSDFTQLLKLLKSSIEDNFRAYDDCDEDARPSILVTFATDDDLTEWSYQTGDTSFTGGCYGYPHWASVALERRSNCKALAIDAFEELASLLPYE